MQTLLFVSILLPFFVLGACALMLLIRRFTDNSRCMGIIDSVVDSPNNKDDMKEVSGSNLLYSDNHTNKGISDSFNTEEGTQEVTSSKFLVPGDIGKAFNVKRGKQTIKETTFGTSDRSVRIDDLINNEDDIHEVRSSDLLYQEPTSTRINITITPDHHTNNNYKSVSDSYNTEEDTPKVTSSKFQVRSDIGKAFTVKNDKQTIKETTFGVSDRSIRIDGSVIDSSNNEDDIQEVSGSNLQYPVSEPVSASPVVHLTVVADYHTINHYRNIHSSYNTDQDTQEVTNSRFHVQSDIGKAVNVKNDNRTTKETRFGASNRYVQIADSLVDSLNNENGIQEVNDSNILHPSMIGEATLVLEPGSTSAHAQNIADHHTGNVRHKGISESFNIEHGTQEVTSSKFLVTSDIEKAFNVRKGKQKVKETTFGASDRSVCIHGSVVESLNNEDGIQEVNDSNLLYPASESTSIFAHSTAITGQHTENKYKGICDSFNIEQATQEVTSSKFLVPGNIGKAFNVKKGKQTIKGTTFGASDRFIGVVGPVVDSLNNEVDIPEVNGSNLHYPDIMDKGFDYKKLRAMVGGPTLENDLLDGFQLPLKKEMVLDPAVEKGTSSSNPSDVATSTLTSSTQVAQVVQSLQVPPVSTPSLTVPQPSPQPSMFPHLPGLLVRGKELARVDHVSTIAADSQSLWHVNMKACKIKVGGNDFPVPYDVELLKTVGATECLDSCEIMLARCMAITHYFKEAVASKFDMASKIEGLEKTLVDREASILSKKQEMAKADKKITIMEEKMKDLEAEIMRLEKGIEEAHKQQEEDKGNLTRLQGEVKKLQKNEANLKAENVSLARASLEGYVEGFKKAMRQSLHFAPSIDASLFSLNKDVIDGEFVDD